jgi:pilus assembly protein TadC
MTRNRAARLLARALFIAAVVLAIELLARGGLSVLERRGVRYQPILGDRLSAENRQAIEDFLGGREPPFQLDSILGWTLRPGFRSPKVTVDAVGQHRAGAFSRAILG